MWVGAIGNLTGARRAAVGLGGTLALALAVSSAFASSALALPVPKLTTVASPGVAGGTITDLAVLSGVPTPPATMPGGTITFSLYGVTDSKCTGTPVFTSPPVTVATPTTSPGYTPTQAGTYTWIASYSGDSANAPVAGTCTDPGETAAVSKATPTLTATASPTVGLGGPVSDTAVLSGGYKPTGSVTFKLYGANDPSCAAAPVFTSTAALATSTSSGPFTPTAAGTYHFVAAYSGDAANAAVATSCASPTAAVLVSAPGVTPTPPPPGACDPAAMSRAAVASLVGALTGTSATPFQATCSAGVRIVLRAKEIRPGNRGIPHHDGFTTIGNTLTHTSPAGQIGFSFNAQGVALRNYARSKSTSLIVFAIVHVRPDRTTQSSEAIQIFNLR